MVKSMGPAAGPPVERIVHVYEPFGGGGGRGGARRRAAGPAEGARKRRLVLWGLAALLVLALLGAAAVPGPAGAEGARRKLLLGPSIGPFWFLQPFLVPVANILVPGALNATF